MDFTPFGYQKLLELARLQGYRIAPFREYVPTGKLLLLRHDVCVDIESSLAMARLEHAAGVTATYFLMVTSPFYNVHATAERQALCEIVQLGHELGLHYDETVYSEGALLEHIQYELDVLQNVAGINPSAVSFHKPLPVRFNSVIEGLKLPFAYAPEYVSDMVYRSDSRRQWRGEGVLELLTTGNLPDRTQLLIHPSWWMREQHFVNGWDALEHWLDCQHAIWRERVQGHLDLYPPEK